MRGSQFSLPEGPSSLPASPSPSLGTSSAKLEAINELIRFDHVYTKPLILEMPSETESEANVVVKIEEAPFMTPPLWQKVKRNSKAS